MLAAACYHASLPATLREAVATLPAPFTAANARAASGDRVTLNQVRACLMDMEATGELIADRVPSLAGVSPTRCWARPQDAGALRAARARRALDAHGAGGDLGQRVSDLVDDLEALCDLERIDFAAITAVV